MGKEQQIRVLLALAGRDQEDVARAVGVSSSTLSRALRGQRTLSETTRRKVVEALVDGMIDGRSVA